MMNSSGSSGVTVAFRDPPASMAIPTVLLRRFVSQVARLPSPYADGGNGSRAHRDRQGVVARLGRRRAHWRGAALVFSFASCGLRCLRLALPHVELAVGHLEVGLVHCVLEALSESPFEGPPVLVLESGRHP